MKDILQKAWYFGLGVFDFTRGKVESLVAEMVRRGEISQQEGPEAVKAFLTQAQEAQEALLARIKETVNKTLGEFKPAKTADLEVLEHRLAGLERRLTVLEEDVKQLRTLEVSASEY